MGRSLRLCDVAAGLESLRAHRADRAHIPLRGIAAMPRRKSSSPGIGQHERASDAVLLELRRMIITLELAPGTAITEESLGALLKCSRTPIREALQQLAREHLVVATPRRGVSVAELRLVDFLAMLEATESIDVVLVRLAAEHLTDENIAELDELLRLSEEADAGGDYERVVELDVQFHDAIAAASNNHFLIEFHETLHRLSTRFVYLGFKRAGTAAGAIDDHRQIVESLRRRDPDVAEAAARTHCYHARDRMMAGI
jgi:DNA-binding GntR family transcriptional regulator